MKKILSLVLLALFLVGCAGNPDEKKDQATDEQESIITEETLDDLESNSKEVLQEAEELSGEVDSLIQNL